MELKDKNIAIYDSGLVVEGPIPVTDNSHPFCAMMYSREPLDVTAYGYVEEEYFVSGKANVYRMDDKDSLDVLKEGLPYTTRILVRRPAKDSEFSGRAYFDIMNATQGYDIEDFWHRYYLWCMEHGHAYVGITSKPVNVRSLKNFDYDRYKKLDWSNGEEVPVPTVTNAVSIPGTEEGLIWDMLGQLGYYLKQEGNRCLNGRKAEYVYLTGQSQSGAYLNTFVHYFDQYTYDENGKHIFDGYMNAVGAQLERELCQNDNLYDIDVLMRTKWTSKTPYIALTSEGDLYLFQGLSGKEVMHMGIENNDTCRYYEMSAAPHTDIICPILTALPEIKKTGAKMPNLNPVLLQNINDFPLEYYICGMLEKLHIWATTGQQPEMIEPIKRIGDDLAKDEYGNSVGGFRTPYVDVPIASYIASNPDDPEGICGRMTYFSKEKMEQIYGTADEYLHKFADAVKKQVEEKWVSETDGDKMIEWAKQVVRSRYM